MCSQAWGPLIEKVWTVVLMWKVAFTDGDSPNHGGKENKRGVNSGMSFGKWLLGL